MWKITTIQCLLFSFCVLGFVVQVAYISESYFQYKTITRIDTKLQWILQVPVVAFCAKYVDVIDRSKLMKETGIQIKRTSDPIELEGETSKLTIKQIFSYTPAANETVIGCSYRDHLQSLLITRTDPASCYGRFEVRKFFMHDLMCYRFALKKKQVLSYEKVSNSINSSGTIFQIDVTSLMNGSGIISLIAYTDGWPFYSRRFAPRLNRLSDYDKMEAASNTYSVWHQTFETFLLPRPYDTDCDDGQVYLQSGCVSDCMLRHFAQKLNRVPSSVIVLDETVDMKHMSSQDMNDPNMNKIADDIEDMCWSVCTRFSCSNDYTVTIVYPSFTKNNYGLGINQMTPASPTTKAYAEAKMSLTEFLTYIFSCFGTWFGISFLSIAPMFKALSRLFKRRKGSPVVRNIRIHPVRRI